jgi:hypothetical protein
MGDGGTASNVTIDEEKAGPAAQVFIPLGFWITPSKFCLEFGWQLPPFRDTV